MRNNSLPLVAHVIHRLGMGGLENGLVNLLNHLPCDRYRHAIICMTDATSFGKRIRRNDVELVQMHKREGKDLGVYPRLWRVFRELRPTIVHSRNLAALDVQIPAWLAGVPVRIHGEHGRDIYDLHGDNKKYLLLRKAIRPLIHRWVPMSQDLEQWLLNSVGVASQRISQLYNGVDATRFSPDEQARTRWPIESWRDPGLIIIGAVGRMESVKDPLNLVRGFIALCANPDVRDSQRLRLAYLGEGPLRAEAQAMVEAAGLSSQCWFAGARDDVAELMPAFDVFVLPSLGEGISNTVLEAMACAIPVVGTAVGGTPELLTSDTGRLVPSADPQALSDALAAYVNDGVMRRQHGANARHRIENSFALPVMIGRYHAIYTEMLEEHSGKEFK